MSILNGDVLSMRNKLKLFWIKLQQKPSTIVTCVMGLVPFLISFWLISRDNGFFSGDMGIMGLMVDDMSKGNFYSWYFYGQNYFGNLEPIILTFLTFFTGNTINALYFWEHFFYFVSLTVLLLSWHNRNYFSTILLYFILFFGIRHVFPFTYFPQGFAFVSMIILSFYLLFHQILTDRVRLKTWHFTIIGFFFGLSIWHNLLVSIVAPIFVIIIIMKFAAKKYHFSIIDIVLGFVGLVLGLVPFIFASIQTNGDNLNWFISNTDSNKLYSLYYVFRDFLFYFLNPSTIHTDSLGSIIRGIFFQPRNLLGFVFLLFAVYLVIRELLKNKEYITALLFLAFLMFLMLIKDYASDSHIFYHVRYGVAFYTLFTFIVSTISFDNLLQKDASKLIKIISSYCIAFLLLWVPLTIYKRYRTANKFEQFYEVVFRTIYYDISVKDIYCDNYYDVCSTVAYLGKDFDFDVQMINTSDSNEGRNPRAIGKVDKASNNGDRVLSLIRVDKLKREHVVLEEFSMVPGAPVYYLIEGDYQ